jgi:ATP-dependent Clp protease protease subunit
MAFFNFKNDTPPTTENPDGSVDLRIDGDITDDDSNWFYEIFGIPTTSPNNFRNQLSKFAGKTVNVWINSNGGSVFAGTGIYNALKEHTQKGGKVVGKIDGRAISAASMIAMACDTLSASPTAVMMIHNPASGVQGQAKDMRHAADVLDVIKEGIMNAYTAKTGLSTDQISKMMDDVTWMSAKTMVSNHFADNILYTADDTVAKEATDFAPVDFDVAAMQSIIDLDMTHVVNYVKEHPKTPITPVDGLGAEKGDGNMPTPLETQQAADLVTMKAQLTAAQAQVTEVTNTNASLQTQIDALKPEATHSTPTLEDLLKTADPAIVNALNAAQAQATEAAAQLQTITDAKEIQDYTTMAATFDKLPIAADTFGPVFRNFAKADPAGFTLLKDTLTAINNGVAQGALFTTLGKTTDDTNVSAFDQLNHIATDLRKADTKLTEAKAFTNAIRQNPGLYAQYLQEQGLTDAPAAE